MLHRAAAIALCLSLLPSVSRSDSMRGPWRVPHSCNVPTGESVGPCKDHMHTAAEQIDQNLEQADSGRLLALAALAAYQKVLSPTKGRNCPMYPSCSAFAVRSVHSFGALQGALMAADRLHRCGHDLAHYEGRVIQGDLLHVDEPASNAPQSYALE